MKPMTLSEFRVKIFECFNLLKGGKGVVEVSYRRRIYRLWIEPTNLKVTTPYNINPAHKSKVPTAMIDTEPCDRCDNLLINGVCMNKNCSATTLS